MKFICIGLSLISLSQLSAENEPTLTFLNKEIVIIGFNNKVTIPYRFNETHSKVTHFQLIPLNMPNMTGLVSNTNKTKLWHEDLRGYKKGHYEFSVKLIRSEDGLEMDQMNVKLLVVDENDIKYNEIKDVIQAIQDDHSQVQDYDELYEEAHRKIQNLLGHKTRFQYLDHDIIHKHFKKTLKQIQLKNNEVELTTQDDEEFLDKNFPGKDFFDIFLYSNLISLADQHMRAGKLEAARTLYLYALKSMIDVEDIAGVTLWSLSDLEKKYIDKDSSSEEVLRSVKKANYWLERYLYLFPESNNNFSKIIKIMMSYNLKKQFPSLLEYSNYRSEVFKTSYHILENNGFGNSAFQTKRLNRIQGWEKSGVLLALLDSDRNYLSANVEIINMSPEYDNLNNDQQDLRNIKVDGLIWVDLYQGHDYQLTIQQQNSDQTNQSYIIFTSEFGAFRGSKVTYYGSGLTENSQFANESIPTVLEITIPGSSPIENRSVSSLSQPKDNSTDINGYHYIYGSINDAYFETLKAQTQNGLLYDINISPPIYIGRSKEPLLAGEHSVTLEFETYSGNIVHQTISTHIKPEEGLLYNDLIPPLISWSSNQLIHLEDPQYKFTGVYSDSLSGIDLSSLKIYLNNELVSGVSYSTSSFSWIPTRPLQAGEHTIRATIKDNHGNINEAIKTFTLNPYLNSNAILGELYCEIWSGITGDGTYSLKSNSDYPFSPTEMQFLNKTSISANLSDFYGLKIHGYLRPMVSGNYMFNAIGKDHFDIYLSTSSSGPQSHIMSSRDYRQSDTFSTKEVYLSAYELYPIKILTQAQDGDDYFELKWKKPGKSQFEIISGNHIARYQWDDISIYPTIKSPVPNSYVALGHDVSIQIQNSGRDENFKYFEVMINDKVQFSSTNFNDTFTWTPIEFGKYNIYVASYSTSNKIYYSDITTLFIYPQNESGWIIHPENGVYVQEWNSLVDHNFEEFVYLETFPLHPDHSYISPSTNLITQPKSTGLKLNGFVQIPESGLYSFSITGGAVSECEIFINTSMKEKSLLSKNTDSSDWDVLPNQTTNPIYLEKDSFIRFSVLQLISQNYLPINLGWKRPNNQKFETVPISFIFPNVISHQNTQVRLTSPLNGSEFFKGDQINLKISIDDYHKSISRIEYYQNNEILASFGSPILDYSHSLNTIGKVSFIAKVYFDDSTSIESEPLRIQVVEKVLNIEDRDKDGLLRYQEDLWFHTSDQEQTLLNTILLTTIPATDAINTVGVWDKMNTSIVSSSQKGSFELNIEIPSADKYLLSYSLSQANTITSPETYKLHTCIDNEYIHSTSLNLTQEMTQQLKFMTPFLNAGNVNVKLELENLDQERFLVVHDLKLYSIEPDSGYNSDWVQNSLYQTCELTNLKEFSYISPFCLEGKAKYLNFMRLYTNSANLNVKSLGDERWWSDIPLNESSDTSLVVSFQNGGKVLQEKIEWKPFNLMENKKTLFIRKGDSLKLKAHPIDILYGSASFTVQGNAYNLFDTQHQIVKFNEVGHHQINTTHTSNNGEVSSNTIVFVVVDRVQMQAPVFVKNYDRVINMNSDWPIESHFYYSKSLTEGINKYDQKTLKLTDIEIRSAYYLRLGQNGPILNSVELQGMQQSYNDPYHVIEVFPDGGRIIETWCHFRKFPQQARLRLRPFTSGVIMESGLIEEYFDVNDLLETGDLRLRFIHANSDTPKLCHRFELYDGAIKIFYR